MSIQINDNIAINEPKNMSKVTLLLLLFLIQVSYYYYSLQLSTAYKNDRLPVTERGSIFYCKTIFSFHVNISRLEEGSCVPACALSLH